MEGFKAITINIPLSQIVKTQFQMGKVVEVLANTTDQKVWKHFPLQIVT